MGSQPFASVELHPSSTLTSRRRLSRRTRAAAGDVNQFRIIGNNRQWSGRATALADPATSMASVVFTSSEIRDHPLRRVARYHRMMLFAF
jgi:hypothetical protein